MASADLDKVRALMQLPPDKRPPDFMNPLEKIEQLLTCPICFDRYKCPKLLPCQHTFCQPCLEGCVDTLRRMIKCPECRAEHSVHYDGIKAFQTNYTMTGFLDIHLQATDGSSAYADEIDEYVHRYNLERCKVCDEKAALELCAHCDRRACKECRTAHSEILRRDTARLLAQVKRLSSRVTEAADTLSKGMDTLILNCETAREDVKEYFRRYQRELHRREESFLNDINTFESTETRLMRNLRDVLEVESTNMTESTERVDAALKGKQPLTDAQLLRYKNLFQEGLDYLRNFQPDAEELFGRKLRFWPGDEANRLPAAIAGFGELSVSHPQFAGRFLPLEQQYVPRPFRAPLDSELQRPDPARSPFESSPRSSGRFNRTSILAPSNGGSDSEETSLRARRRQKLEEEAWNRVVRGSARNSDVSPAGGRQSPWSSALTPSSATAADSACSTSTSAASPKPKEQLLAPPVATSTSRKPDSIEPSEEEEEEEEDNDDETEPPRSRIRIVCRGGSEAPANMSSSEHSAGSGGGPSTPIPIVHFPPSPNRSFSNFPPPSVGESTAPPTPLNHVNAPPPPSLSELLDQLSSSVGPLREPAPPCVARRNRYQQRAHTNPDPRRYEDALSPRTPPPPPPSSSSSSRLLLPSAAVNSTALTNSMLMSTSGSSSVFFGGSPSSAAAVPRPSPNILRQESDDSFASGTPPTTPAANGSSVLRRRDSSVLRRRRLSAAGSQSIDLLDSDSMAEWRDRASRPPRLVIGGGASKTRGGVENASALNWPRGLCFLRGSNADIAVADSSNHRICIFSSSGRFLRSFGGYGSGPGELDSPAAVAQAPSGQLLVSDRYNHRVCVFDPSDGRLIREWGGHGPANGRFNNPWGVACDDLGTVYVVDKDNHRVQMFDMKGAFLGKWGGCGTQPAQLCNPLFVAIGKNRQIYVTDSSNHRVSVFDSRGAPLFTFGSEGFASGQLKLPRGIAIDSRGFVLVADSGNHRIQVFTERGDPVAWFGGYGTAPGQLKGVEDIALTDRALVLSDRENHRLQLYSN